MVGGGGGILRIEVKRNWNMTILSSVLRLMSFKGRVAAPHPRQVCRRDRIDNDSSITIRLIL